jgi:hypothetical protein
MAILLDLPVIKWRTEGHSYLDAHVITDLNVFHKASASDNNTSTFVTADQRELSR